MKTQLTQGFIALFFLLILIPEEAFSDSRKEALRRGNRSRQFISFGGNYKSDFNSKQYDITLDYQYKNHQSIYEIDLRNRATYSETTKIQMHKTEELYDGEISSKQLIGNSNNYINFYNRSKHDKFSAYSYDIRTSLGLGRMLFDGKMEADINIGWNDIKNGNSEIIINPTLRVNFDITENIKFIQKGYLIKGETTQDDQLKTQISYRLNDQTRIELYHNYDKSRYLYTASKIKEKRIEISRSYVLRIKYDF